jgi:hypothetical protein
MRLNNEKNEVLRDEKGKLYFTIQLNDSLVGHVELNSMGRLQGDMYVWNVNRQVYTYYFPYEYSIGDIEQVFVRDGDDWIELVFSLAEGEVVAIARHDSIPYNMKKIVIRDNLDTSTSIQLEFSSEGNVLSKVEAQNLFEDKKEIVQIRENVGDFVEHISRSHLQVSREFDIVQIFTLNPIEVLKLSNY